jgi:hypothetical protein
MLNQRAKQMLDMIEHSQEECKKLLRKENTNFDGSLSA